MSWKIFKNSSLHALFFSSLFLHSPLVKGTWAQGCPPTLPMNYFFNSPYVNEYYHALAQGIVGIEPAFPEILASSGSTPLNSGSTAPRTCARVLSVGNIYPASPLDPLTMPVAAVNAGLVYYSTLRAFIEDSVADSAVQAINQLNYLASLTNSGITIPTGVLPFSEGTVVLKETSNGLITVLRYPNQPIKVVATDLNSEGISAARTLLRRDGVMFDGTPTQNYYPPYLYNFHISSLLKRVELGSKIDLMLITHPHHDHIDWLTIWGMMSAILEDGNPRYVAGSVSVQVQLISDALFVYGIGSFFNDPQLLDMASKLFLASSQYFVVTQTSSDPANPNAFISNAVNGIQFYAANTVHSGAGYASLEHQIHAIVTPDGYVVSAGDSDFSSAQPAMASLPVAPILVAQNLPGGTTPGNPPQASTGVSFDLNHVLGAGYQVPSTSSMVSEEFKNAGHFFISTNPASMIP